MNLNILTVFSYKKFINLWTFIFVFFLNPVVAEQLLTKSAILSKSPECFTNLQYKICNNLSLELEKIHLVESEQKRYKCQASILGLQTEIIEAYFLKKNKKGMMIPYVIKNC